MHEGKSTKVTILGTSGATPEAWNDTASFIINDRYLVDTGWFAVANLKNLNIQLKQIEAIIFTHFHHDHYMALPSLLYSLMDDIRRIRLIGPAEELEKIVKLSFEFLQADRYFPTSGYPELVPLRPGESFETDAFVLDTCASLHPVPGLCYRYTDKGSGTFFSFTGDTAFHPPIIDHVRGSSLLITEASLGPVAANPDDNAYLHSGAIDAARLAEQADVGKLLLVHGSKARAEACVEAAKTIFSKPVEWPKAGQSYYF